MWWDDFAAVMKVADCAALLKEVVSVTNRLGFEKVNAMVVIDHFHGESEFINLGNTPAEYRESFQDVASGKRDPVMQHCKRASVPIVWNQDTYTAAGQSEKWEIQARFGYRTGIALALHLSEGRHFFIGVDRDHPLPANRREVARRVAHLQLFAAHAQDAALRVLLPMQQGVSERASLTPRELEALRWTMEGKTAWELGNILGISEQTAGRHVNSATQKLGCVNKTQAVVKALRLGLIH